MWTIGRGSGLHMRHPRPARSSLLILPFAALAAISAGDLAIAPCTAALSLLALAPGLSNLVQASRRWIAFIGFSTLCVTSVLGARHWQDHPVQVFAALSGVLLMTVFSFCVRLLIRGREQELAQTQKVAETVQRALIRPLPSRLGALTFDTRYLAAAEHAQVGGDVYDAAWTPSGIRIMIGDVMGKGLGAVETASSLVGAFREAAFEALDLPSLADRLQISLVRRTDPNVFVTAVLIELPVTGETADVLTCGHPPPLFLSAEGKAHELDLCEPSPPLGLLDLAAGHHVVRVDLAPGDGLLLYTDGATEARGRNREFFALESWANRPAGWSLDSLVDCLQDHAGGRLGDDAALILLRRAQVLSGAASASRSAEI